MWACGLDWAGPGQRQVADACGCGNEPWGSVKCGEFLDQLQTGQLLKKDSAPWSEYSTDPEFYDSDDMMWNNSKITEIINCAKQNTMNVSYTINKRYNKFITYS